MKSWIISIIALFMGVCSVQAKNVPVEKAMNAAEAYCRQSGTVSTRSAGINGVGSTLQLAYTAKPEGVSLRSSSGSSDACFYIFNLGNGGGFIIVSADDRACPVLGYSNEGAFDLSTAPPAFMEYLANYQNEITALLKDNPDIAPDPAWQRLETGSPLQGISTRAAQLLATASWGQSWPYNTQCPEYNGQQTITGCVATAMAIVMKYHADHGYAARGTGSHSYSWQGQTLSATFGTYDYQNMPLTSTEYTNNQTKIDAVAKLMFHCGVSVDATYGAGGTSANQTKIAPALKNYFGFDARCELIKKSDYSTDAWKSFIKKEIDLNQPILYYCSGSGAHMFICDGYNDDDKFHFNWGQSGGYNGWFELTATIQPGYGSTYFFDNSQMVIGIKKAEISVAEVAQLSLVSLKSGKGMAKNVETVVQNQTFTVTASTVANMSTTNFDGVIAVALYDAAGNRKEILERKAINLTVQGSLEQYAPSLSFSNCKVTTTISPTDILRLIASADGGNTWKLV
ncbi:MAG: C10 family peptidase, partial [Tannerella sp.]|nr:C10 family peptidase [Tannerella sp.]